MEQNQPALVEEAVSGDRTALETLLQRVEDPVFNLSLRMLGTVADAEDASQEILIRVMTSLSSFRGESAFETWVYRLAVNYLINYKKSMFAHAPLSFGFYGADIRAAQAEETDSPLDELTREELAQELKLSCTNVMLQCLDAQSRIIFILGTMFRADSRTAGEILEMTPENYRQKLSRIRKKVAGFLAEFCGLSGTGLCSCKRRVGYAMSQGRLDPNRMEYKTLQALDRGRTSAFLEEMEKLDALSLTFEALPDYRSTVNSRAVLQTLLDSPSMQKIQEL